MNTELLKQKLEQFPKAVRILLVTIVVSMLTGCDADQTPQNIHPCDVKPLIAKIDLFTYSLGAINDGVITINEGAEIAHKRNALAIAQQSCGKIVDDGRSTS